MRIGEQGRPATDAAGDFATGLSLRAVGAAGGAVAFVLVGLVLALGGLPYQDVPNHLARAVAIADLLFHDGARFGDLFAFHWQFVPYLLGDLLHAATAAVLPPETAARAWMALALLAFPGGVLALLAAWRAPTAVRVGGGLFALYLSADWLFLLGFLNFRYGLALALLALAASESLQRRSRPWLWAAYAVAVVAGYLTHLSAPLFLVVAAGALVAVRTLRTRRVDPVALLAWLPVAALLAWHVLLRGGEEVGASHYLPPPAKLKRVVATLVPFKDPAQILVALAFLALLAWPVLQSRFRGWPVRAWETAALAAAFFGLYVAMPEVRGDIWGVDVRALPLAWTFAALTALHVGVAHGHARGLVLGALAVAGAHAAVLLARLPPANAANDAYRGIAVRVPDRARVLPVITRPRLGLMNPGAHAASFATIHARAIVPYTFAGDRDAPMPYFVFRTRVPDAPQPWWYLNEEGSPDWAAVARDYDYLLVQVPADWSRLPRGLEVVARNDVVTLLRFPAAVRSGR